MCVLRGQLLAKTAYAHVNVPLAKNTLGSMRVGSAMRRPDASQSEMHLLGNRIMCPHTRGGVKKRLCRHDPVLLAVRRFGCCDNDTILGARMSKLCALDV